MWNEEAFKRTFEHAMEIWFEPEIRRRQEKGTAPKPFLLRAAQVIMYADGRPQEIRLNEEVQAIGEMKLKEGVTKKDGDPVFLHELQEVPRIRLPDSADPDCAHFTLFQIGERWYGSFDFRYNTGRSLELLSAADEFFETGSAALAAGRLRPAIDNLFSAAELAAKAYVLSTPMPGDSKSKSHGVVHSRFNMLSRHGNIESDQRKAFNALADARARARYPDGKLLETSPIIAKWEAGIRTLISDVRKRVH